MEGRGTFNLEEQTMVGSHPSLVESIVRTSPPLRTSLAARLSSHDPSPPPGADNGIGTHGDSLQPEHAGGQVMDESARVASTVDSLEETISRSSPRSTQRISKQFWQAGDFFPDHDGIGKIDREGLHHARLHPRFLHSNATSHKWALGAFVELLDNSMDEVGAGCSYVKVDKVDHPGQGSNNPMLLVEDNGGGMNPKFIRNCMSFGFSMKKGKQMIGQYGNGFKTSTMRLGADALVLTKSRASATCSVGLLSFTFLSATKSQDVIVPIIDYSLHERTRMMSNHEDWQSKLSLICQWGPFESEAELWKQFDSMPSQGTRVYIWNLWHTSDGVPELDFLSNDDDIRLQGGEEEILEVLTRKRKADEGMRRCHAYRHSLRAYVAILYLKWPEGFKISIRGKEVVPAPVKMGMKHNITYEYRPRQLQKEESVVADVSGPVVVAVHIGFATEAPDTNVSGFCVYHRNRLIKPYWKVYSSASSVGRGVIGYLQVDFVEPAHDKQDFENTPPLQKLEKYLKRQVPHFWRNKAHYIGYQEGYSTPTSSKALTTDQAPKSLLAPQQSSLTNTNTRNQEELKETPTAAIYSVPAAKKQQQLAITQPAQGQNSEEKAKVVSLVDEHIDSVKRQRHSSPQRNQASSPKDPKAIQGPVKENDASKGFIQPPMPRGWNWADKEKAGTVCMQHMKREVASLQEGMQTFCNVHQIGNKAQGDLGKIFGTSISNILSPVKVLSTVCGAQMAMLKALLSWLGELSRGGELVTSLPDSLTSIMLALDIPMSTTPPAPFSMPATASASGQSSPRTVPEEQATQQFLGQISGEQQPAVEQEASRDAMSIDGASLTSHEYTKVKEEEHLVPFGIGATATIDRVKVIKSLPIAIPIGNLRGTQGVVHPGVLADVQGEEAALPHSSTPILSNTTGQGGSVVPEIDTLAGPSGDLHDVLPNQSTNNIGMSMKDSTAKMQFSPQPVSIGRSGSRPATPQSVVTTNSPAREPMASRSTPPGQNPSRGKKTHSMEELGRDVVMQFLQGKQKVAVADKTGAESMQKPETSAVGDNAACEAGRDIQKETPEVKKEFNETNHSTVPQMGIHTDVLVAHEESVASLVKKTSAFELDVPVTSDNFEVEGTYGSCERSTLELRRDPTLGTWADGDSTGVKRAAENTAQTCDQGNKRLKPSINGDKTEVDFVVPTSNVCDLAEMTIFERSSMDDGEQISCQFKGSEGFERVHVVDKPSTAHSGLVMGGEEHSGHAMPPG